VRNPCNAHASHLAHILPPATSSGGYRGGAEEQPNLIDQSPSGGPIGEQQQDARQGSERATVRPGELDPYAGDSLETRRQAEEHLASGYRDARGREYDGSGAGLEGDPSA
jgi:hypothetical protein